jgi:hypothetical protein
LHPNKKSPIETSKSQLSSASSHLAFPVWCLWQGAVSKFSPTIALKNNKDKNSFLSFQSESYSNYIEQVVNTQMGAVMGHALTLSWRLCTIASHHQQQQQHKFVWDLLLKYRLYFPRFGSWELERTELVDLHISDLLPDCTNSCPCPWQIQCNLKTYWSDCQPTMVTRSSTSTFACHLQHSMTWQATILQTALARRRGSCELGHCQ